MNKFFFVFLSFIIAGAVVQAQPTNSKIPPIDKSPMDMVYYPANYPVLKIQDKLTEPLIARVIYSRPSKSGRNIFGELVEYGKVWRLGANEATELELFRDVKIDGKKINKGKYTLYAIVNPDNCTIILNKETDIWGSFKYDPKKDLLRIVVPVQKNNVITENFSMYFEKIKTGIALVIIWDDVSTSLPINF